MSPPTDASLRQVIFFSVPIVRHKYPLVWCLLGVYPEEGGGRKNEGGGGGEIVGGGGWDMPGDGGGGWDKPGGGGEHDLAVVGGHIPQGIVAGAYSGWQKGPGPSIPRSEGRPHMVWFDPTNMSLVQMVRFVLVMADLMPVDFVPVTSWFSWPSSLQGRTLAGSVGHCPLVVTLQARSSCCSSWFDGTS